MNKVEKISLAGCAFTVYTDAYDDLCSYIADVERCYSSSEDAKEIVEGIEERLTELLRDRCPEGCVVDRSVVAEVTSILGSPGQQNEGEEPQAARPGQRRLYRDLSSRVIGGVCSGIAARMGIDKVYVRLLFVMLAVTGLFWHSADFMPALMTGVYIVLWISMPAAKTCEQKCMMYGEGLGIDDVEASVRRRMSARPEPSRGRSTGALSSLLAKIVGIFMIVLGVAGVISGSLMTLWVKLCSDMVMLDGGFTGEEAAFLANVVVPLSSGVLFLVLAHLVVILPFVMLLYGGILLTFGLRSPSFRPGLIMLLIWIAALVALVVTGAFSAYDLWSSWYVL